MYSHAFLYEHMLLESAYEIGHMLFSVCDHIITLNINHSEFTHFPANFQHHFCFQSNRIYSYIIYPKISSIPKFII